MSEIKGKARSYFISDQQSKSFSTRRVEELFVTLEGKKTQAGRQPTPQTPATSLLTNIVDKQHGSITPPDGVEGVRCPFPVHPTFPQTVSVQNVSPWQNFVLAQHNRCAVQLS